MLKKRLVFTLLYSSGQFCLSRNFRLQRVGNIDWLLDKFQFETLAGAIDELVILCTDLKDDEIEDFLRTIDRIQQRFFVPISIGGQIRNKSDADRLFRVGADKVVLNSAFHQNLGLCKEIISNYGSQAVIGSVDFKLEKTLSPKKRFFRTYFKGGTVAGDLLENHLETIQNVGCGEVLLRSIDLDGTGNGLCMEVLGELPRNFQIPLILSGGSGRAQHLLEGIANPNVNAVSTANLLNFVGTGLHNAREFILREGGNLSAN
jgi:cyclase